MKAPKILLLCSSFFVGSTIFTSLAAQELPPSSIFPNPLPPSTTVSDTLISPAPNNSQLLPDASTIMGHIAVANIALIHEAYPEATANIKSALEAVRDFSEKNEFFNSHEPIKLANLSYFSDKGEQNFWLPILDDRFVVRSMDGGFLKSKKPDIQTMDAHVVYYQLALNVKNIMQCLEDAELALKKKEYKNAEFFLQEAIRGTFVNKSSYEDAIIIALDHLMLGNELIKDKNYSSASAALTHVRNALENILPTLPKKSKPYDTAARVLDEVTTLQTRINKSSNTASLKINDASFGQWAIQINSLNRAY